MLPRSSVSLLCVNEVQGCREDAVLASLFIEAITLATSCVSETSVVALPCVCVSRHAKHAFRRKESHTVLPATNTRTDLERADREAMICVHPPLRVG